MSDQINSTLGELVAAGGGIIHTGPFGSQLHAADYVSEGIPCIMPANMKDNRVNLSGIAFISDDDAKRLSKYLVQEGDIVYSRRGDVTAKALIGINEVGYFCGTGCLLLRPGEKFDSNYLTYYLSTPRIQAWIISQAVGATMPNLNTGILFRIPFTGPEKPIQEKISATLRSIDDKIDLNNRINAELEAMAKTLYDYWFVQFDFPDANGKPYKTSGGKMEYNATLKRKIPVGWEVNNIGSIVRTELGGTPSTAINDYWKDASIPWLSSAETATFPVISSEQMVTQSGIDNSAATLLPKGTVVISIVRYIRPSILGIDAATNQSVVGIMENEKFKSAFIYPYFCREIPRLMGLRTGAQQPHINKGTIDDSPIVIPPSDILADYYKVADAIFEKIMIQAFQSYELIKLRDWLLPLLMNGQVTVK
ncbi:restriction endonuclease subunit S [Dickeya dianthicola]|uniref:restriction endonuclease subunit S n=1 Tax=Dickeya dianthicola TaxID=204039 RepID=UPI0003A4583C|nr:restriction endonuclease subunit S [Dickeya dianthicola]MCI4031732.1 restriction endonuclease subunit S [Dickeya dianthicola]MCI4173284.1 restriction endonuclease subunit S [Dickeya dianthicola]MCI4179030.1 restriction endonuclease subunit S [Dickeya dianthicola]MCI4182346.1 restriction endonuclease subunit S [Dickeya dianthicola]MCI4194466.1 restriction endonuclease subunit S [Dickeya dianthicola]